MIRLQEFYEALIEREVDFFAGVPDSLLKDFNAYVTDHVSPERNIVAANEGGAIGLATGYHLATKKIGLVYMQNSGQGNAVNPLMSLADKEVYSIPMLLLIGWRGEPGVHDEPQHIKQGRVTLSLLDTLEVPYDILPTERNEMRISLEKAISEARGKNIPYALVVKKGTFEPYDLKNKRKTEYERTREQALKIITSSLNARDIIVSTTGKLSRELFEYREERKEGHERDFLTVGSMGHNSMIALGIALQKPERNVYCFDGDGAAIMHMGSMGIIGQKSPRNLKHIVFNNGAHDSVGGQPTVGFDIDLLKIAEGCGYKNVLRAKTEGEIKKGIEKLKSSEGPCFLEIRVKKGARKDLGRPTTTPLENKKAFMQFLEV